MGKRIILLLITCLLMLTGTSAKTADAATIKAPYMAEQGKGKAPDIKLYMTGSKMRNTVQVSGIMGDMGFTQNGDIVSFKKSGEGIRYIILLDNSGSVNKKQFAEAKKQLINMRKSLRSNDKMLLYAVGSNSAVGKKKNVFGRTVQGSDKNKKSSDCKKIQEIKYMDTAKSKTVLYRSLNEVLATQTIPDMRTVVLLLTDGEDDSKGKDIDKVSTANEVKNASVPVYGILLHNDARKPNKKKMAYTRNKILAEMNCRGYYYDCSTNTSGKSVKRAFTVINQILKNETYVVNLSATTNKVLGKSKLNLTVNNSAIESIMLDYSDYQKDDSAPTIVGGVKKVSGNSVSFSLQDDYGVNIADANEKSHYVVQTKADDNKGKVWTIESASAVSDGDEIAVTLTLADELYTDDYILKCSDIRDESQDSNEMNASIDFSIEDGLNASDVERKEMLKTYWWIGLIAIVLIIGIIIILVIRKKAVKVVEVNTDELVKADTKLIRLTITDRSGAIKDVEWNVEGSLFVGRSDICNIFFDDDRLSKQHFVIEVTKMGCYIEDLESTNGTFVNGVKMTNRRMLLDGDVITAGREKIVFHIPKNQSLIEPDEE